MKKFLKLLFVLFWMCLIFFFSMDSGDASSIKSNSIIDHMSQFFLGKNITLEEKEIIREKYEYPLRKGAHLTLYFCLGVSVLLLLKEYHLITKKEIIISICLVFLYACSDEIHQLFVPNRSGELLDVLLDTFGGSLGVLSISFFKRGRE